MTSLLRTLAEIDRAQALTRQFQRVQRENRGGSNHRRRYKSAVLTLLEHLLYLLNLTTHFTYPNISRVLLRRTGQVQAAINDARANRLPPRDQPVLARLARESSEEDSEAVETVVVTSGSETEVQQEVRDLQGVWRPGRFVGVTVTASNPLLRQRSSASSSSRPPEPSEPPRHRIPREPEGPPPERVELPEGVEIRPFIERKISANFVLALDWHQCLDCCRLVGTTLRPAGYSILDIFRDRLLRLRQIVPNLCVIILSYCHCDEYRQGVLSVQSDVIDYKVVTDTKTGEGGKLSALTSIFRSGTGLCGVDDNDLVLAEYLTNHLLPHNQRYLDSKPIGVLVPRRGRRNPQQRVSGVEYFRNVADILDSLINGL